MTHDSKDSEHATCAAACAKNGVPLAIDNKLYLPIGADHKNQNLKLPRIEKKAKVTGTFLEKGGVQGIAIKTVKAAE